MQHLYSVCASDEAKASFRVSEDVLLHFLHYPLGCRFDETEAVASNSDSDSEHDHNNSDDAVAAGMEPFPVFN